MNSGRSFLLKPLLNQDGFSIRLKLTVVDPCWKLSLSIERNSFSKCFVSGEGGLKLQTGPETHVRQVSSFLKVKSLSLLSFPPLESLFSSSSSSICCGVIRKACQFSSHTSAFNFVGNERSEPFPLSADMLS